MSQSTKFDAVILGAGAAGMMCARYAASTGKSVLIIDHAKAPGEKIRISGGGRCNFTNLHCSPQNFISQNPHFAKSALKRYTQWDFIEMVSAHGIAWHEKTLGQLFCDSSAKEIIAMLVNEMKRVGVEMLLNTSISSVGHNGDSFTVNLGDGTVITAASLVVATGGKSIPKMGATGLGYQIAKQFSLPLTETRPALVPLTFGDDVKAGFSGLSGLSVPARVTANGTGFSEGLLFTHRGLSGPSILQSSSYWREKDAIQVQLLPDQDIFSNLREMRQSNGRKSIGNALALILPSRLAEYFTEQLKLTGNLADHSDKSLKFINDALCQWELYPTGTEGYRTAEVTLGGVDTDCLSSKTMEARDVRGLYMIGEVVDVTGWLGGFNFQWAWSSGWAAGTSIASK
ncbi:NAD(P)/FAD-dependent oxidoreductase [Falsihalocynthiibacter sp. SS001]|uniref:NAD(P)/FAD-dependent oxidoreductase n=1 Tax=Falsihalocynthiibacter sp. SS001 TaxID=3349698 RepID=UPI0036D2A626